MVQETVSSGLAEYVTRLLKDGKLREIREQYGLSLTTQAQMIGVGSVQLAAWESGETSPIAANVSRVATWYERTLDELIEHDVRSANLDHISTAAQYLARSYATIESMCDMGLLECVRLGGLGVFLVRDETGGYVGTYRRPRGKGAGRG